MAQIVPKLSETVIEWIEDNLIVPDGDYVGQPLILADFQKEIITKVFDNPKKTKKAIISMGRGAAKSTLCACILAVYLIGPLAKQNTQLVSTAMTKEQAALTFDLLANMISMNAELEKWVIIRAHKKEIYNPHLRITYKALSSDSKDKQGGAAYVAVHDEVGSIRGPKSPLISAVDGGMAKNKDSIGFYISTQAEDNNDLLSIMIDTYKDGVDPQVVVVIFTCPLDVDPLSEEALTYHPAWSTFGDKDSLRMMQNKARLMPTEMAEFRQFFLNQRVDSKTSFINPEIWAANGDKPESWHGKDVYISLDLSTNNDLTSLTIFYQNDKDDRFSIHPIFYLPAEGIREKSQADRVQWDIWAEKGFLKLVPGRVITYDYVAKDLKEIQQKANIVKFAFDRYNIQYFKRDLIKEGFSETWIKEVMVDFGQGTRSMHPAIQAFGEMIEQEKICHGNHPILTYCFNNVLVEKDNSNWGKFVKKAKNRKIDGAITTVMCAGIWKDYGKVKSTKSYLVDDDDGLLIL